MKYNFLIIPYRDQYFAEKYGFVVRDLMMIRSLVDMDEVNKIIVVNRPVSIYERLINKMKKLPKSYFNEKLEFVDTTSYDLLGPLRKRKWTESCYSDVIESVVNIFPTEKDVTNVLLDFTPLASMDYGKFNSNFFIWYDLIDNFSKHHAYDRKEKSMVVAKYKYVDEHANLVTGVTDESINSFMIMNKTVMNNGLLMEQTDNLKNINSYTFGFIGFVSDKLDTDFLINLADKTNERIVLYGDVYSKKAKKDLRDHPLITLKGKFHHNELDRLMCTFEFGLIPYKIELSHDGSPLKLYQYILYGKPVITTESYKEPLSKIKYVLNEETKNITNIIEFMSTMRKENNDSDLERKIKLCVDDEYFLVNKIRSILNANKNKEVAY